MAEQLSRNRKRYDAGEVIFAEGGSCDGLYIIESGRVEVYRTARKKGKDSRILLGQLGPKAVFGEMAMLDNGSRAATAKALEQTVCTIIRSDTFSDQIGKIPPWMLNLLRILVQRLRTTNDQLVEAAEKSAASRRES
jgi:CRP-like cAMP-binding protein